jgi:3-oxoacyl-[acyl-carrier protein] reductase
MIIVTGASRGLGKAISKRLNLLGHETCGISRDITSIEGKSYKCDVSCFDKVKKVAQSLRKENVTVTGLINAAGIASMNLALTTPASVTEKIIKVNLLGTIYCCQLFAPLILRNKKGSIINFSTVAVAVGLKGESVYVASKSGIEGFSRSFAREMAGFNINVNCIAPGPIDTDLTKGVSSDLISKVIEKQIIPKKFTSKEVCDLVEILLDQKTSSISGQVLYVGGI